MQVTLRAAKDNLTNLIDAALSGEDVVIAKDGKPVARLVPIRHCTFTFGLLRSRLTGPGPDFLQPMDEHELALWEGSNSMSS